MIDDARLPLKEKVLLFLEKNPYYRHAAWFVGKDEETLRLWREQDQDFKARCEAERAKSLTRYVNRASAEFILTHADPETFNIAKKSELSGSLDVRWNDGSNNTIQSNATSEATTPSDK